MIANRASLVEAIASMAQRAELLRALERNCECQIDDGGELVALCPGHEALGKPMFIRHMEFARTLTERLLAEEFREQTPVVPCIKPRSQAA